MDVLVQLPLSEEQRARLEAAAPGARFEYVKPRTVTREQVEAADAIVGNVPTEMLAGASGLRLLQLNSAGYEQYAAPGVLPDGCALCCATGAYGQAVSEHLFAMVLSLVKRLPAYQDRQRAHDWYDLGPRHHPQRRPRAGAGRRGHRNPPGGSLCRHGILGLWRPLARGRPAPPIR